MEKREARRKALKEGDITQTQAKREKNKARLQDAASVGIAALGIKGAYSEWQEMREHNSSMKEEKEKAARHKEKRDARRRKAAMLEAEQYKNNSYQGSMPNLVYPDEYNEGRSHTPPAHYNDDNPFTAYPPPPGAAYPSQYPPPPGAAYTPPPPPPPPHDQFGPPPMGPARSETRWAA
jgi:hypothetical protein